MKWFHHECAAHLQPKIQLLGSKYGAEAVGIYWGLLEQIGLHSETFYLKVIGVDDAIDEKYSELIRSKKSFGSSLPFDPSMVCMVPLRILSGNVFAPPKRVISIIRAAAELGLFDLQKWLDFSVLYDESFEQSADDYTRRVQRSTERSGQSSGHNPKNVRTESGQTPEDSPENVRNRAEQETKEDNKSKADNACYNYNFLKDESFLIDLDEPAFQEYSAKFKSVIVEWNRCHKNKFAWNPTDEEIRKFLSGGTYDRKVSMCYDAYKLLNEKINYPELVLRALGLLLKASEKTRITNPTGWLWSCLHGSGEGTLPWVQLLSASEESNIGSHLRSRRSSDISSISSYHPP